MPNNFSGGGGGEGSAAPIVIAGANLLGQGINAWSQSQTNKANAEFQWAMYERQRTDALSDWDRNNAYNSPAAQMKRFKEAGLNPNLIYGQTNQAAPVRSSSPSQGPYNAPRIDLGGVLGQFMQVMLQQNQISIQERQMKLMEERTRLTGEQADLTTQKYATELGKQDLQGAELTLKNDKIDYLRDAYPEMKLGLQLANDLKEMNVKTFMNRFELEQALKSEQVREISSRILTQAVDRLEKESRIELNQEKLKQLTQAIDNLKSAKKMIDTNQAVRQKDLDYYEGKEVFKIISNTVGKAKDFLPQQKNIIHETWRR